MTDKDETIGKWCWHVHHDILVEKLNEPLESRIEYIKTHKPKNEVKIRLKAIQIVKNQKYLDGAWKMCDEIEDLTWIEYVKVVDSVWEKYHKKIEQLHKKEHPNCTWNGKSILNK